MEKKTQQLNKILDEFLKNEARATDARILAIRRFLSVLNESVERYVTSKTEFDDPAARIKLSDMIDGMADIYREEISSLLLKRGKLQEYIVFVKTRRETETAEGKMLN